MNFYDKHPQLRPLRDSTIPYLEELRKKYGSTVYDINPYVEVFKIRDNVYAMYAPCTHAVADNWIYLVEGPEKALFIDNGYGIGDLKGLGEYLTGKPVISAVTHCHGDHAGGNPQWDKIYCHEYCAQMLNKQMQDYDSWWKRFNHVGEEQERHYYKDEDIIPFNPYEPVALKNHAIINLGEDYDIELIHTGAHSPGLSVFLDKKGRILYTGDALFYAPEKGPGIGIHRPRPDLVHPECMGLVYYSHAIAELASRVDEFDYVMAGHGYVDGPASVATDAHTAVKEIMEDPYNYSFQGGGRHGTRHFIKRVGYAEVLYDIDFVLEELSNLKVEKE